MRYAFHRRVVVAAGSLVFATGIAFPIRGEHVAGTLVFRPATPIVAQTSFTTDEQPAPLPALPSPPQPATPQIAPLPTTTAAPRTAFPRIGASSRMLAQSYIEPQVNSQTRRALNFYGGYSARATLSQLPRPISLQQRSAPPPVRRTVKPFEVVHREPTVSPYLNLHRDEEDEESAPNYFTFVRPQMEQLETNRMQQRELQQLRGQLQSMSTTVVGPRYQAAGVPATGTAARYMDTAQFYGGLAR
jgi:hypothetical protein